MATEASGSWIPSPLAPSELGPGRDPERALFEQVVFRVAARWQMLRIANVRSAVAVAARDASAPRRQTRLGLRAAAGQGSDVEPPERQRGLSSDLADDSRLVSGPLRERGVARASFVNHRAFLTESPETCDVRNLTTCAVERDVGRRGRGHLREGGAEHPNS